MPLLAYFMCNCHVPSLHIVIPVTTVQTAHFALPFRCCLLHSMLKITSIRRRTLRAREWMRDFAQDVKLLTLAWRGVGCWHIICCGIMCRTLAVKCISWNCSEASAKRWKPLNRSILDVINNSKIQFVCVDASYAVNRRSFRRHNASFLTIPQRLLPLSIICVKPWKFSFRKWVRTSY